VRRQGPAAKDLTGVEDGRQATAVPRAGNLVRAEAGFNPIPGSGGGRSPGEGQGALGGGRRTPSPYGGSEGPSKGVLAALFWCKPATRKGRKWGGWTAAGFLCLGRVCKLV
jgi:hypothetical protein